MLCVRGRVRVICIVDDIHVVHVIDVVHIVDVVEIVHHSNVYTYVLFCLQLMIIACVSSYQISCIGSMGTHHGEANSINGKTLRHILPAFIPSSTFLSDCFCFCSLHPMWVFFFIVERLAEI